MKVDLNVTIIVVYHTAISMETEKIVYGNVPKLFAPVSKKENFWKIIKQYATNTLLCTVVNTREDFRIIEKQLTNIHHRKRQMKISFVNICIIHRSILFLSSRQSYSSLGYCCIITHIDEETRKLEIRLKPDVQLP
jgi:hypothetical protein